MSCTVRCPESDLGGASDGLSSPVAASDHHLLGEENLFGRNLDAQVTAGNHDAVAGLHDLVESASAKLNKKKKIKKRKPLAFHPSLWITSNLAECGEGDLKSPGF